MKRGILILLTLLVVLASSVSFTAYDTGTSYFTKVRQDMTIKTPKGLVSIDALNNLMINEVFVLNLNKVTANTNIGTQSLAMSYFVASDVLYSSYRNSVFIFGASLDTSHVPQELYKDTKKYLGKNYNIVMEYVFDTKELVFKYSLPGTGVYAAAYNTTFYEIEEELWPKEDFDWSLWNVPPKAAPTSDPKILWMLAQVPFTEKERLNKPSLPEDEMLMQIYRFDLEKMTIKHYLYVSHWSFHTQINKICDAKEKYKHYVFNPAAVFIQENKEGYLQVINMRDDLGVAFEFNLKTYGNPVYVHTYWK